MPSLLPWRVANAIKSRPGAVRTYIVASSIEERIPKRGNRVNIDHALTNCLANAPCVAPPTMPIAFFLDLISHTISPMRVYGSEPTARVA